MSGNNCNHIPDHPRWFVPPQKHANRPAILRTLIKKIRDYYLNPGNILPGLNAVNQSTRQQRSERREACISLLSCIVHYTDLVTLRVGIPQPDGSMAGLTMPFLANLSGLNVRRAERAIHDLKNAGLIIVHSLCQKLDDMTYKGFAAIRIVAKQLFTVFGLDGWLKHERSKAQIRKDKKAEKKRRKDFAQVKMLINAQPVALRKTDTKTSHKTENRTQKMSPIADFFISMKDLFGVSDTS